MEEATYDVIAKVERTHWWYSARRRVLDAVVTAELDDSVAARPAAGLALDFGCGTGANLPVVARCGRPVGMDRERRALLYARERGGYAGLFDADGGALPLPDGTLGWAFALDVLEHLDDDAGAAAELFRALRPGGRLVITVPAFPALWGPQDDVSHHRRRYTRRRLLDVVRGAGFRVRRITYINIALLVPIFLARRALRLLRPRIESENTLHPSWTNPILERLFGVEARIVPHASLPFGVSLLCVAERPAVAAPPSRPAASAVS
jgi:SAM-dependent methyltransferase